MKRICLVLFSTLALSQGMARAGIIDITIGPATLSGASGDVLAFFGTLTNNTGATVFLNADNFNLSEFPPGAIDDSPFFDNTPAGFLDPNGSTGNIELFDITIPVLPAGNYGGSFQVVGGATADDQTILGTGGFTAVVTAPEPSPAIMIFIPLIGVGLALLLRIAALPAVLDSRPAHTVPGRSRLKIPTLSTPAAATPLDHGGNR